MFTRTLSLRRWFVAMIVAALLAVTALYGPVALELAGVAASTPVYACTHSSGGC